MHKSDRKHPLSQQAIQRWSKRIEGWKNSGLNQREYCRRENISACSFSHWKRRLEESPPSPGLTLIKLDTSDPGLSPRRQYAPPASSALRFWFKDFCIEVSEDFSPPVLSRLIDTLRSV